jgi:hypothetical protein
MRVPVAGDRTVGDYEESPKGGFHSRTFTQARAPVESIFMSMTLRR